MPTPESMVELYLTLQDINKLQSLKEAMITRIDNNSFLDSNTAYVLLDTILSALGVNNENS